MKPVTPINIECIPEKEYLSPEFQLDVSSKSDGLFIYETFDPAVFTVDQDGIVTITGPGRADVLIKQLESENFAANQINRSVVVSKSKPTITFLGPQTVLLRDTPISARILQIETITELIRNVFSVDETVLKIRQIVSNEYELIPVSIGKTSIIVSTRSNYYFDSTSARFDIEVLETLQDQPLIININTFGPQFKHNALKDIDILTSNNILEPKSNNLQIAVQQQTRGYNYDIPVLNLAADKFINSINNYNKEILCCAPTGFLEFSIQWDFGNNPVYDFSPYEGNINDRPRINIFRSDGNYIDYVSGGFDFLKIPQNSGPENPNAYIYQKWGDRNTGIKQFRVPDIQCLLVGTGTGFFSLFNPNIRANFWDFTQDPNNKTLSNFRITYTNGFVTADWGDGAQSGINSNINYSHTFITTGLQLPSLYYGVDFFTTEDLRPTLLSPPSGQWTITNTVPGEIKYQYLFIGNYEKNIVVQLPLFVPPNAPAGLTASNITVNSITISWATTPKATSYRLDVSTVSNFSTRLTGYDDLIVNGTSQQITGLTAGTIYYVRVRAVNAAGTSSNSATLTQITVPVAPNQPTISNVTIATFTASWNSVTGASSYRVDVATTSDFTSGFITGYNNRTVSGATNVSVIGLSPGTTYYVRVRAFNDQTANPVTSANSPTSIQTTHIAAPTGLTASAVTENEFNVSWNNANGATSYRLDVSTVDDFTTILTAYNNLIVNGTSQSITGLDSGRTYYIRVRSVDSIMTSNNSSTLIQNTVFPAVGVINITNVTSLSFQASWNSVPNAVSYRMDISLSSSFSPFYGVYNNDLTNGFTYNNATINTNSTIIPFDQLPNSILDDNTRFYVRVRAVSPYGVSSESSSVATLITRPSAPTYQNTVFLDSLTSSSLSLALGVQTTPPLFYKELLSCRVDFSTTPNFSTFLPGWQNTLINPTLIPGTTNVACQFTVTGLNQTTTYYMRYRFVNSGGQSAYSSTEIFKLNVLQGNVNITGLTVSNFRCNLIGTNSQIRIRYRLSWNSIPNISSYYIMIYIFESNSYYPTFLVNTNFVDVDVIMDYADYVQNYSYIQTRVQPFETDHIKTIIMPFEWLPTPNGSYYVSEIF